MALHINLFPIWFESDSQILVDKVNTCSNNVPWRLRTRWRNCLHKLQRKGVQDYTFYREVNAVADAIANEFGLDNFTW